MSEANFQSIIGKIPDRQTGRKMMAAMERINPRHKVTYDEESGWVWVHHEMVSLPQHVKSYYKNVLTGIMAAVTPDGWCIGCQLLEEYCSCK